MLDNIDQNKLVKTLLVIFIIEWVILAIKPYYRSDWLLENVLVIIYFPVIMAVRKRVNLSNLSYLLMFIFLCLHIIGAHYTYAEVPYDDWFKAITGNTLNGLVGFERNHFDRLIHFLYGVLLYTTFREITVQRTRLTGFWSYFLPYTFIVSTTVLYEQIEWAAAEIFGGELGMAYLGTQGDVWDGHKDMILASIGALMTLWLCVRSDRKRAVT